MSVWSLLELVSYTLTIPFLEDKLINSVADLSGLTLQSGPSRIVKDEYTPGSSIVGNTLDIDGEIGTIQHHPTHIGLGYPTMQIHPTGTGNFLALLKPHFL